MLTTFEKHYILVIYLHVYIYYGNIKFVSDLRQVGGFRRILGFPPPVSDLRQVIGFPRVLGFPPPIKMTSTI